MTLDKKKPRDEAGRGRKGLEVSEDIRIVKFGWARGKVDEIVVRLVDFVELFESVEFFAVAVKEFFSILDVGFGDAALGGCVEVVQVD